MYTKVMATIDKYTHLIDVHGVDASADMISIMRDRILPIANK